MIPFGMLGAGSFLEPENAVLDAAVEAAVQELGPDGILALIEELAPGAAQQMRLEVLGQAEAGKGEREDEK